MLQCLYWMAAGEDGVSVRVAFLSRVRLPFTPRGCRGARSLPLQRRHFKMHLEVGSSGRWVIEFSSYRHPSCSTLSRNSVLRDVVYTSGTLFSGVVEWEQFLFFMDEVPQSGLQGAVE